jgi:hypothetical protein
MTEELELGTGSTFFFVDSARLSLGFGLDTISNPKHPNNHWTFRWYHERLGDIGAPETPTPGREDTWHGLLRISTLKRRGVVVAKKRYLVLPGIELILLQGGLIVWMICRKTLARRRIRAAAQQCVKCGYNLCATPDRCPECGTKVIPRFEPLSWREPQWSIKARPTSSGYYKDILRTVPFWLVFAAFIMMLVLAIFDDRVVPRLIGTVGCMSLLALSPLELRRWSKVILDEPRIWIGGFGSGAPQLLWKNIDAAGIRHDSEARPILWLQVKGKIIERAIAPEVDLRAVQARLTAWCPTKTPLPCSVEQEPR